jgi:anaerobic magnesium-protoporphyrin IX monomethyl ester cyclase
MKSEQKEPSAMRNIVILCSPTSDDFRKPLLQGQAGLFFAPLGTLFVAQTLKNAGYEVRFFDGNFDINYKNDVIATIRNYPERVVFVGFYLTFLQIKDCTELIRTIKDFDKNLTVVAGGPFPSVFYKSVMESDLVDICCIGDGSDIAVKLADALVNNQPLYDIPNICFKDAQRVITNGKSYRDKLTETNQIYYENFVDIESYVNKFNIYLTRDFDSNIKRSIPLLIGLGCSYKCAFCENALLGHKHVSLPATAIFKQIKYYNEKFNIDSFSFFDEDFFVDRQRMYELLDLLEGSDLKISWGTQTRVNYFNSDYINSELLKRLERAGCVRLSMGIESGSPKMLKKINKGITPQQIINAAETGKDSSIYFSYSIIINLPDETREDFDMTFDLVDRVTSIKKNSFVSAYHSYFAYPGTPLSIEAEKKLGFSIVDEMKFEEFSELSLSSYNELINPQKKSDMYKDCKTYYYSIKDVRFERIVSFRSIFKIIGKVRKFFNFYHFPIDLILKKWIRSKISA